MKTIYISVLVIVLILAGVFAVVYFVGPGAARNPNASEANLAAAAAPQVKECDLDRGGPVSDAAWRACETSTATFLDSLKDTSDPQVQSLRQKILDTLEQMKALDAAKGNQAGV